MSLLAMVQFMFKSIILTAMLFAGLVLAQSESPDSTNRPSSSDDASAPTIPPAPNKPTSSKPEPSERVFKPSEEISEDLPVPFPVDI